MKRSIALLLLTVLLLSAFSLPVFAEGDSNAQSGEGTTHAASDGYAWYNTWQYLWKVTLYVGKSDRASKQSGLSGDFYRLGTVLLKSTSWTLSSSVKFGSGTKADYYSGAALSVSAGASVLSDASCPAPPIACGGSLAEVKSYFGSSGTLNTVLSALASGRGTTAASLLSAQSFEIGGVTKSGWPSSYLLPNGTENRVPWVIVYEPVIVMHLKDRTTLLAFTATEFAVAQKNGWYDWHKSDGAGQGVDNLTHHHLPSSVQLEESWFGYPVYPATSQKWSETDIIKGGGWGMRWLPAAVTEPEKTEPDYTVSLQPVPSPVKRNSAVPVTVSWTNKKDTSGTALCELYSGSSLVWSSTLSFGKNQTRTSVLELSFPSAAKVTLTAKINYAKRNEETDPNDNLSATAVTVTGDGSEDGVDYGCSFGAVTDPGPTGYGNVTVVWKNETAIGGTVLCELYRDGTRILSKNVTFAGKEQKTERLSVYYPSYDPTVLTARINYENRDRELDPNDNVCSYTVNATEPEPSVEEPEPSDPEPETGSSGTPARASVYDLSVSEVKAEPNPAVAGGSVLITFRTDNWSRDRSCTDIPVELLLDGKTVYSETFSYSPYGSRTHSCVLPVEYAGYHQLEARINYANRFYEDNLSNNSWIAGFSAKTATDFSVSDLQVAPPETSAGGTVTVTFRTENGDPGKAYEKIPVELLYNNKVVYTETADYSAGAVRYHTVALNVGTSEGTFPLAARVNWANRSKERDPDNNRSETVSVTVKSAADLRIRAVAPNSDYREGMTVVTSFTVFNDGSRDILPSDRNQIVFEVSYYKGTRKTVVSSQTWEDAVIPAGGSNLVYFKWTVPGIAGQDLFCKATVNGRNTVAETDRTNNSDTLIRTVAKAPSSQTPDTDYEAAQPDGFRTVSAPVNTSGANRWDLWEYADGSLVQKHYGVTLTSSLVICPDPDIPSVTKKNGKWGMKSGYGFTAEGTASLSFPGDGVPEAGAYTGVQSCSVLFPEFQYSSNTGRCSMNVLRTEISFWIVTAS